MQQIEIWLVIDRQNGILQTIPHSTKAELQKNYINLKIEIKSEANW